MVGVAEFESTTFWSQARRSTKLSYTPVLLLSFSIVLLDAPNDFFQLEDVAVRRQLDVRRAERFRNLVHVDGHVRLQLMLVLVRAKGLEPLPAA